MAVLPRYYRGIHGITAGMGIIFTVLPRYWGRNMRDSCGDGDLSCGTTAVMGLSFSHVYENS